MGPATPNGVTLETETRPSAEFDARGFSGPHTIFSGSEAREWKSRLKIAAAPSSWSKGSGASSPEFFEIATRPGILDRVVSVLGPDVMLCGANLVEREPGQTHAWHTDVHLADPAGRSVTVWIGLENVTRKSALQIIPGSHRFGFTAQERLSRADRATPDITAEDAISWSREVDTEAAVLTPEMSDGDALFIDGLLWHGSDNTSKQWRTALVLHYATPDKPVRVHSPGHVWPFRFQDDPLPPCVMVSGGDRFQVNRMVPAPIQTGRSLSRTWDIDSAVSDALEDDWNSDPHFFGSTRSLSQLLLKTAVFRRGREVHSAHAHFEEQLVVPLRGEGTLVVGDESHPIHVPMKPGAFVYLAPGTVHTYRCDSDAPVVVLDIKWRGTTTAAPVPLGTAAYDYAGRAVDPHDLAERRRAVEFLVDGPTASLNRLTAHVGELLPGWKGPMHVDAYDTVLVVLAGKIDTLGREIGPGEAAYYAAGEPHHVGNAGQETARYIAFELHNTYTGQPYQSARRWITSRLPRPVRKGVRNIRSMVRRVLKSGKSG